MFTSRQRLLASTLLASVGFLANPAYAQDSAQSTVPDQNQATDPGAAPPAAPIEANPTPTTSAQGEPVQQAQDIIVTGTRIPQPNLESGGSGHRRVHPGHQAFRYDPHRRSAEPAAVGDGDAKFRPS